MAATTQRYRDEHAELVRIVERIAVLLVPGKLPGAAPDVRRALSTLAGKLNVHLAMEDNFLYPRLKVHSDPKVRAMAVAFSEEMSGLRSVFLAYNDRWTDRAIAADVETFIKETGELFAALGNRIRRENTELYALVDSLEVAVTGRVA